MNEWCVKKEYEEKLMKILDKLPKDLKDDCNNLREKYKISKDISSIQEEIESDLKYYLSRGEISVENAYIVSNANNCYGIWESCVNV